MTLAGLVIGQVVEQLYRGIRAGLLELGLQRVVVAARNGEDLVREMVAAHKDKLHLLPATMRRTLLLILADPSQRVVVANGVFDRLATDPDFGVLAAYEGWLRDSLRRAANLLYLHLSREG